jgi:hypothetical protein
VSITKTLKSILGVISFLIICIATPPSTAAPTPKCNLSSEAVNNGSITWAVGLLTPNFNNPATANNGQSVVYKFNSNDGFELNALTIQDSGKSVTLNLTNELNGNGFYAFTCNTTTQQNHKISSTFNEKTFEVDIQNISIAEEDDDFGDTCTKPRTKDIISATGRKTYNFQACDNYEITNVLVNLVPMGAMQSYEVKNPRRNHSIVVTSQPIRYDVNITIGDNGQVRGPKGRIYSPGIYTKRIRSNRDISFTSLPSDNHHISSVLLGATELIPADDSYDRGTTSERTGVFRITGPTTLNFTFLPNNYSVETGTPDGDIYNGIITASQNNLVNNLINDRGLYRWRYGSSVTFNVIPSNGNQITSVKVDDTIFRDSTLKNTHTFGSISSNHKISATSIAIQGNRQSTSGSCSSNSSMATLNSQGKGVTQNANNFCVATPGQLK